MQYESSKSLYGHQEVIKKKEKEVGLLTICVLFHVHVCVV